MLELSYDYRERLAQATTRVGDAVVNVRTNVYCYERLCEERDGSGATRTRFFTRASQSLGVTQYTLRDQQESAVALISSAGAVDAQYAYDPFGRRTTLAGSATTHDGFVGYARYLDGDVTFARYRAYSADVGRWMSRDPIGTGDGPNVYAYVGNNATSRVDLLGLAGLVRHDEAVQGARRRIRDEIACAKNVAQTVLPRSAVSIRCCTAK